MTDWMSVAESLDCQRPQAERELGTNLCKRLPCCHPGRQFGGPEACRNRDCECHRRAS